MLLVIVLCSIFALMAVPAYHRLINRNRLTIALTRLQGVVQFAQKYALYHRVKIIFCGSSDCMQCDGLWSFGQIVMTSAGKRLLKRCVVSPNYSLRFKSSLGHDNELVFLPSGLTHGQQGSFYICFNESSMRCGRLIVLRSGRSRIIYPVPDHHSRALACQSRGGGNLAT